jgi:hypothetical protein
MPRTILRKTQGCMAQSVSETRASTRHASPHALDYLDDEHRIHVIGCGSFAAAEKGRPESTPRSYTLLRVRRDLKGVEILRRHQKKADGPFNDGGRQILDLI